MSWKVEAEQPVSCSVRDFYSGVDVWLQRPNVINRRLLGAVTIHKSKTPIGIPSSVVNLGTKSPTPETMTNEAISDENFTESSHLTLDSPEIDGPSLSQLHSFVSLVSSEYGSITNSRCLVRKMLPKMRHMSEDLEAVFIDEDHHTVTFCPLSSTPDCSVALPIGSYRLQFSVEPDSTTRIILYSWVPLAPPISAMNGVTTPTTEWLNTVLLPKVSQWSEENASHKYTDKGKSLISLARYSQLYRELKEKYGEKLVKNWPEATDPHKFVYEDIAIATYLLVLWEREREELMLDQRQSFIDLGCGNGLLVYLLTAEGHPGKGIDLRERKIWRMYGSKAKLEVCALTPSGETLFPDYDWLLGNHSDELTPWIPVMAARSSYQTRYFVLPCCPHDFETKYHRRGTDRSQYRSYLDYVREIGETMGFKVHEDTMRIPSSKRICQIGRERTYPSSLEAQVDLVRMAFLDQRCPSRIRSEVHLLSSHESTCATIDDCSPHSRGCSRADISCIEHDHISTEKQCSIEDTKLTTCTESPTTLNSEPKSKGSTWASGFQPRSSVEHVRNCSLIDRDVKALVVSKLTSALLETDNFVYLCRAKAATGDVGGKKETEEECAVGVNDSLKWNLGGKLHLNEAVKLLDTAVLKQLKREFGGLQTLLRNEHQVFQVCGGYVQLRNWTLLEQPSRKRPNARSKSDAVLLRKTKSCWFFDYHPQGCPRKDFECPYAHGLHEQKERPDFNAVPEFLCSFDVASTNLPC